MKYIQYLGKGKCAKDLNGYGDFFTDTQDLELYQNDMDTFNPGFRITTVMELNPLPKSSPNYDERETQLWVSEASAPYFDTAFYYIWVRYYRDNPKPKYTIVYNMPGYLPESEPMDAYNMVEFYDIINNLEAQLSEPNDIDETIECTYRTSDESFKRNGVFHLYLSNGYVIEGFKNT